MTLGHLNDEAFVPNGSIKDSVNAINNYLNFLTLIFNNCHGWFLNCQFYKQLITFESFEKRLISINSVRRIIFLVTLTNNLCTSLIKNK